MTWLLLSSAALAQEGEQASVDASETLAFGNVSIPREGNCQYTVDLDGSLTIEGGINCHDMGGFSSAGEYKITCSPGSLLNFETVFINEAPQGVSFEASDTPLAIDGNAAAGQMQTQPCDNDGESTATVTAVLNVSSNAPVDFAGRVGTITLEVTLN